MTDTDAAEMHIERRLSLAARVDSAVDDQRQEIISFCEAAMRNIDTRIARIARNQDGRHTEVPAWQHPMRRRECLRRLKQEV